MTAASTDKESTSEASTGSPTQPPPARPLRKDAERNRQRALIAAAEVFAARGLNVTMDEIAAHAQLGVGTLYRRFPTRELLIEAIFDHQLDQMVAWAEEALAGSDPWAGLTDVMVRTGSEMAANAGLRDLMLSEANGAQQVDAAKARMLPLMEELVTRCREAGLLRPDVRATDIVMIHFIIGAVLDATESADPGLWRRYLTLLLGGLRTGDSPEAPTPPAPGADVLRQISEGWKPPRRRP